MEQIVKIDGKLYYGKVECHDADDVYSRFRDEYNASVGRVAFKRLSRLGSRKERVHGGGFYFKRERVNPHLHYATVPVRLMGLVCGSYCWMLGSWDLPRTVDDENFEQWFDWAFSKNSGALRKIRLTR